MKDQNLPTERFTPEDSALLAQQFGKTTDAQHEKIMDKLEKQRQPYRELQAQNKRAHDRNHSRGR